MIYNFDNDNYIVRFDRGEELISGLMKFVQEKTIHGAWLSGLGGAESAELGFYNLGTKQYEWKRFEALMEITSLQGNVAWQEGQPALHIHATLSGRNFQTVGGHVKSLIVGGTCEVFLQNQLSGASLARRKDEQTGLNLLDL